MKMAGQVSIKDLKDADIFAGLSDSSLEEIARLCSQSVCQAGEYCAVQGETTDRLLIVNEGKVAIEMKVVAPSHTHTVTIATLPAGRVCAWSALVPPHLLTASVKCIESTQMISISATDLQRILEDSPLTGYAVIKNLAGIISSRLRESYTQLVSLICEVIKQGEVEGSRKR